jgi:hypothetical protein
VIGIDFDNMGEKPIAPQAQNVDPSQPPADVEEQGVGVAAGFDVAVDHGDGGDNFEDPDSPQQSDELDLDAVQEGIANADAVQQQIEHNALLLAGKDPDNHPAEDQPIQTMNHNLGNERQSPYPLGGNRAPPERLGRSYNHGFIATLKDDPQSLSEVERRPEYASWRSAMDAELKSLHKQGTIRPVELPPGHKPLPSKWVFKIKQAKSSEMTKAS